MFVLKEQYIHVTANCYLRPYAFKGVCGGVRFVYFRIVYLFSL